MARGDVVYVDLPPPPGGAGREQAGRRPAVIVQADFPRSGPEPPTVMIVPLTTQVAALRFSHTIRVEPSVENGLTVPSVLLVFQLRAVDRQRIDATIGRLEQRYVDQLDAEIRRLLGVG